MDSLLVILFYTLAYYVFKLVTVFGIVLYKFYRKLVSGRD
jgi:hypothetical protein